jgi:hypothetical protein
MAHIWRNMSSYTATSSAENSVVLKKEPINIIYNIISYIELFWTSIPCIFLTSCVHLVTEMEHVSLYVCPYTRQRIPSTTITPMNHLWIQLYQLRSSFIHQCFYTPLLGPGLFFSFVIFFFFTQTVGLLERVISPSQGRYLHTRQHKHRINAHTDIHALSRIRTHDSVRASEDNSCLRPPGHCDRPVYKYQLEFTESVYCLSKHKYSQTSGVERTGTNLWMYNLLTEMDSKAQ